MNSVKKNVKQTPAPIPPPGTFTSIDLPSSGVIPPPGPQGALLQTPKINSPPLSCDKCSWNVPILWTVPFQNIDGWGYDSSSGTITLGQPGIYSFNLTLTQHLVPISGAPFGQVTSFTITYKETVPAGPSGTTLQTQQIVPLTGGFGNAPVTKMIRSGSSLSIQFMSQYTTSPNELSTASATGQLNITKLVGSPIP